MPRHTALTWLVMPMLIGCCACGRAHLASDDPLRSSAAGFDLRVWPESLMYGATVGRFGLSAETHAGSAAVVISVEAAEGLRALYLEVDYDAQAWHPVAAEAALPGERLELPYFGAPGRAAHGQLLIHPDHVAGFSGSGSLLTLHFARGPAPQRVAAAPMPGGAPLLIWDNVREPVMRWAFGGPGDYDQNGEVNIADLTPLGLHFGAAGLFVPLTAEYVSDGDGNGEINVADVTPIGAHYGERLLGYDLYVGTAEELAEVGKQASMIHNEPILTFEADQAFTNPAGVQEVDVSMLDDVWSNHIEYSGSVGADDDGNGYVDDVHGWNAIIDPIMESGSGTKSNLAGGLNGGILMNIWPPVAGAGSHASPFMLDAGQDYSYELHEFSSLENVTEDYTAIILNIRPLDFSACDAPAKELPWPVLLPPLEVNDFSLIGPGPGHPDSGEIHVLDGIPPFGATILFLPNADAAPGLRPERAEFIVGAAGEALAPIPMLTALPRRATHGATLLLDASLSRDLDGTIVSYEFDPLGTGEFGPAQPSAQSSFVVTVHGTLQPAVRVTDDQGLQSCYPLAVAVIEAQGDGPPTINLSSPGPGSIFAEGESIEVNAQITDLDGLVLVGYRAVPGADILPQDLFLPAGQTFNSPVQLNPPPPGQYTLFVRAVDTFWQESFTQVTVQVSPNQAPKAFGFASPNPTTVNSDVLFDASSSFDPDGSIEWYRFDVDGDGTFEIEVDASAGGQATYQYSTPGDYTVVIQVEDNLGMLNDNNCQFTLPVTL